MAWDFYFLMSEAAAPKVWAIILESSTWSWQFLLLMIVSFTIIWCGHIQTEWALHSSSRAGGFISPFFQFDKLSGTNSCSLKGRLVWEWSAASLSPTTGHTKELNYLNAFLTTDQDFLTPQWPRRSRREACVWVWGTHVREKRNSERGSKE